MQPMSFAMQAKCKLSFSFDLYVTTAPSMPLLSMYFIPNIQINFNSQDTYLTFKYFKIWGIDLHLLFWNVRF